MNLNFGHRLERRGREQMVDSPWSTPPQKEQNESSQKKSSVVLQPNPSSATENTLTAEPDFIHVVQNSSPPQEETADSFDYTIEDPIMQEPESQEDVFEQSSYEPSKHHHDDDGEEESEEEKKERKNKKKKLKKKERFDELDRKRESSALGASPTPTAAPQPLEVTDRPPPPTTEATPFASSSSFTAVFTVVTKTTGTTTIFLGDSNPANANNNQAQDDMRIGMGMIPPIRDTSAASDHSPSPLPLLFSLLFFFFLLHPRRTGV